MNRMPLPAACLRCHEPVLPTDQRQYYANRPEPVHHACWMRPIIGSVAHLAQRCSCYVPGAAEGDDPALTRRQAAEAALALWEQQMALEWKGRYADCNDGADEQ